VEWDQWDEDQYLTPPVTYFIMDIPDGVGLKGNCTMRKYIVVDPNSTNDDAGLADLLGSGDTSTVDACPYVEITKGMTLTSDVFAANVLFVVASGPPQLTSVKMSVADPINPPVNVAIPILVDGGPMAGNLTADANTLNLDSSASANLTGGGAFLLPKSLLGVTTNPPGLDVLSKIVSVPEQVMIWNPNPNPIISAGNGTSSNGSFVSVGDLVEWTKLAAPLEIRLKNDSNIDWNDSWNATLAFNVTTITESVWVPTNIALRFPGQARAVISGVSTVTDSKSLRWVT